IAFLVSDIQQRVLCRLDTDSYGRAAESFLNAHPEIEANPYFISIEGFDPDNPGCLSSEEAAEVFENLRKGLFGIAEENRAGTLKKQQ
ncbi:MAG: hypothetical protein ACRCUT_13370, partial [Spirochaetota bacterium]